MNKINSEIVKAKFKSFGKVKLNNKLITNKDMRLLHMKKEDAIKHNDDNALKDINNEIAEQLLKDQRRNLEKKLIDIKEVKTKKGKTAAIFRLKEDIVGSKKEKQEATSFKNPKSMKEVFEVKQIKKVSLEYCVQLLTNRNPKDDYFDDVMLKNLVHDSRMNETINDDDIKFSSSLFYNTLDGLRKENNNKFVTITKSGKSLHLALCNLFERIWNTEIMPAQWNLTNIVQIFKGQGPKNELGNYRNIHTKTEIPKLFGKMVTSLAKPSIIQGMTKFQIGTKPGHRAQEHLFVLKSVMALYSLYGLAVILQLWDISKFFDREHLRDALDAIYNRGVDGKLYRLLYMLNKDTVVKVRTAVGDSEEEGTGEGLGQGTTEGALISASSIDYTVNKHFKNSPYEIGYAGTMLQPLLFQDDVSRLSLDPEAAQMGNVKMEAVMESKLLDFNLDKSCFLVIGNKQSKVEINMKLKENPLKLCGQNMKRTEQDKYLGDQISAGGLKESVHATIKKRSGKVFQSIYEIVAVVEDCRSNSVGGIMCGLDLWELAVIPFLLNNCDTWTEIDNEAIEHLEKTQNIFLRTLLATPRSTPTPALCWETGMSTMENRIILKKLAFYHHLLCLSSGTLAKEIMDIQEKYSYPGLVKECNNFIKELQLPDIRAVDLTKQQWKRVIKKRLKQKNKEDLLYSMDKYKKLDNKLFKQHSFETKQYLRTCSLPDARLLFSSNCKMMKTVQMNQKSNPKFIAQNWKCSGCSRMDVQEHLLWCPGYAHLREDMDKSNNKDLVAYYRQIIKIRETIEE